MNRKGNLHTPITQHQKNLKVQATRLCKGRSARQPGAGAGLRSLRLVRNLALFGAVFLAIIVSGCATASRNPVPKEAASAAQMPKLANIRLTMEPGSTNLVHDLAGLLTGFDASGGP